ncbi:hypothetical protein [Sphingobium sp. AP50]|uniref:hypothetical protein n=1 Tax=Sphingobium sp. AP50 TaxID=1884369 RepID=UPI00210910AC|nr:hypothetical protein [Sphingobium sp. AP50]
MAKHLIQAEIAIIPARNPGRARARRGNGLEAELRQPNGAARISGIGDDDEAAVMHATEMPAQLGSRHGSVPLFVLFDHSFGLR